jgi:formylglycine-generating enzyme required for sulfatase activity
VAGNSANIDQNSDWDNSENISGGIGHVTTVGSNGRASAYGTFDQTGNVFEWIDAPLNFGGGASVWRGGSHGEGAAFATKFERFIALVVEFFYGTGFRLATADNPSNYPNFTTVGNAGNAADGTGLRGAVAYTYQIGKYNVTNCEYAEFLNAVAATDTHNLYRENMGEPLGGISRSGSPGSYTYAANPNYGNKPVVYVDFFDCLRYCNWLHNGKPSGAQDASTTEDGAYTLSGATTGAPSAKNTNARYWIPTENEWYKAAYYKGGNLNAGYWTYATQSNTAPTGVSASPIGDGLINGIPASISQFSCPT